MKLRWTCAGFVGDISKCTGTNWYFVLCSPAERSSNWLTGEVNNIDDLITIKCSPENTLNLCGLVSTRPPINLIKASVGHPRTYLIGWGQMVDAVLSRQHMDTGPLGVSRGVGYGSFGSCGMGGGASIDQTCSDTSDGCFNPTSKFPMRSSICCLIPWRSHWVSQLALTPRSLDTGPPRVSRDVWSGGLVRDLLSPVGCGLRTLWIRLVLAHLKDAERPLQSGEYCCEEG